MPSIKDALQNPRGTAYILMDKMSHKEDPKDALGQNKFKLMSMVLPSKVQQGRFAGRFACAVFGKEATEKFIEINEGTRSGASLKGLIRAQRRASEPSVSTSVRPEGMQRSSSEPTLGTSGRSEVVTQPQQSAAKAATGSDTTLSARKFKLFSMFGAKNVQSGNFLGKAAGVILGREAAAKFVEIFKATSSGASLEKMVPAFEDMPDAIFGRAPKQRVEEDRVPHPEDTV